MPAPTYKLNICAVGERPVEDVLCALSCQPRWHSTQTWVLCQQEYLLSLHEFGSCHRHWGWATPLWPGTERHLHGIPLAVTRQGQDHLILGRRAHQIHTLIWKTSDVISDIAQLLRSSLNLMNTWEAHGVRPTTWRPCRGRKKVGMAPLEAHGVRLTNAARKRRGGSGRAHRNNCAACKRLCFWRRT